MDVDTVLFHAFYTIFAAMLKWLRQHWKVNNRDLFLILCTFAITGTLTAYISKQITSWLEVERYSFYWWALKIGVLFFGYQVIILVIGFCFGQLTFFWNYEIKILRRMRLMPKENAAKQDLKLAHTGNRKVINIAIFASGKGSNAKNIIEHFRESKIAKVNLIVTDQPAAGVVDIARSAGVPIIILEKEKFFKGDGYLPELLENGIGFIVLAGFMRKVPTQLTSAYKGRIINIHPALLPKYGGKGMYGERVHQSVLQARERESGITIHYVDDVYDNGEIIFQCKCSIEKSDTPETLACKIHRLEHAEFPRVIEDIVKKLHIAAG